MGLFVDAEIAGRSLDNVLRIPRAAVRGQDPDGAVHLDFVGADNRLKRKTLAVASSTADSVLIHAAAAALAPGDRLVLTNLETTIEGMLVEPIQAERVTQSREGALTTTGGAQ